jgi:septum formation protein
MKKTMKKENVQMVVLASRSPRRVELLKQIGIDCMVLPADVDESVQADESPTDYVMRLAEQKALAVSKSIKSDYTYMPIVSADTTVVINGEVLGKPENDEDALQMLKKLSGKKHEVHTAVAVYLRKKIKVILNTTIVDMMPLTQAMIDAYIVTGEHRDKAGGYGIQGNAGAWVKHIEGSYTGVMGLPLFETLQLINKITAKKI